MLSLHLFYGFFGGKSCFSGISFRGTLNLFYNYQASLYITARQHKFNYLFYRTEDVLEQYLGLKERQKRLIQDDAYTQQARHDLAVEFGRLLSYPEEGIGRLMKQAAEEQ